MLNGRIAAAPISWGVCEVPGWGLMLSTSRVLPEMTSLGLTATLPAVQALSIFVSIGLGLALPYLLASWVPGVARALRAVEVSKASSSSSPPSG